MFDQISLGNDPLVGRLRQLAHDADATGPFAHPSTSVGARESPERHLLFGLLTYQNDIITRLQLLAAFDAWCGDKSKSLEEWLVAQRALVEADRQTARQS
ncbi:MAG: hypothetical protein FJ276_33675 [Planctomycetes bacterium]|nr:hypothetical protein [Planctomycetota bacterium]